MSKTPLEEERREEEKWNERKRKGVREKCHESGSIYMI